MRTTVDIDDDILALTKSLASQSGKTLGQTISHLLRQSMVCSPPDRLRNGVPLIRQAKAGASPLVTLEIVNKLRDE